MASRMEKYFETNEEKSCIGSRSKKNEMLYKEINNSEIDKFEINSNATVLTEVKNNNNIDVEKIKKILDTRYNSAPKRKSIRVEVASEEEEKLDATKEYDINTILEKAKEEKEDDIEQDRLKKLKDTQFNILSNLNLSKKEEEGESEEEKTLINLINTITEREMLNREKELDPLDLLSDLKDNNEEDSQEYEESDDEKTLPSSEIPDETIDMSFYTNSNKFTESDFDDFNDLKAEVSSHKVLLKIVIILLIVGIAVGTVIILNLALGWNLF